MISMNSYIGFAAFFAFLAMLTIAATGTNPVGAVIALFFAVNALLAIWSAKRLA